MTHDPAGDLNPGPAFQVTLGGARPKALIDIADSYFEGITQGRGDIMVVVGGVIPPQDFAQLYEAGAKAIFGPGTPIADAASDLLKKLGAKPGKSAQEAAE